MYQPPTVFDFQRNLDTLIHSGEHAARAELGGIKSLFAAKGILRSTMTITASITACDKIHKDIVERAMQLIDDFATGNAELSPGLLAATTRPRLNSFATFLLSTVPHSGFPQEAQRFRTQYTVVFQQRLDGALRDIQIGFIGGHKITITVAAPEVANAAAKLSDAVALKPGLWGISIDLLKIWRWFHDKWRSDTRH